MPNILELDTLMGQVTLGEGLRLAYLSHQVAQGVIVELGSFKGKSTCFLAAGSREGNQTPIYAVDAWELGPKDTPLHYADKITRITFDKQTQPYKDLIRPIQGFSQEVGKTWDKPIGLLYIDAVHEYEAVIGDYNAWSPHIVKGGFLIFHDRHLRGVRQAIEEVKADHKWTDWSRYERLMTARRL